MRIFKPTTIAEHVGEGGISTGLGPLPWGALGPTFSGASTNGSGLTITRAGAFALYAAWASGDRVFVLSGSSGTSTGFKTINSKDSDNAITNAQSSGASKTSVAGYIVRESLAGGLLNTPSSLPAADVGSSAYADWVSARMQDAASLQPTKIVRVGGWKAIDNDQDFADAVAGRGSFTCALCFRIADVSEDGTGIGYTVRAQPRNAGGALASVIETAFTDGGAAESGEFQQYFQDDVFRYTLTEAQAAALAFNVQVQQAGGDSFEACSLLGVGAFALALFDEESGGPRGRGRGRGRKSLASCS